MKIAAIAALWHCASAFAPSARAGAPSAARSRGRALFSDAPGGCTNDPEAAFAAKIKAVAEQELRNVCKSALDSKVCAGRRRRATRRGAATVIGFNAFSVVVRLGFLKMMRYMHQILQLRIAF